MPKRENKIESKSVKVKGAVYKKEVARSNSQKKAFDYREIIAERFSDLLGTEIDAGNILEKDVSTIFLMTKKKLAITSRKRKVSKNSSSKIKGNLSGPSLKEKLIIQKQTPETVISPKPGGFLANKDQTSAEEKAKDPFTEEEIKRILQKARSLGVKEDLISIFFFDLGMKLFEIANLNIDDVDIKNQSINIGNKKFDIDNELFYKIVSYIGSRKAGFFFEQANRPLTKDDVFKIIKDLMSRANVKKLEDIESALDLYKRYIRSSGKPFMYWDHIDKVIEIRKKTIEDKMIKKP